MKNLIIINGTMGVGKTSTSLELQKLLSKNVFLDGDWCWYMKPFIVTDETKQMVINNITHLLNNYIRCSEYENIIFCWVMHQESIISDILSQLDLIDCNVFKCSLVCSEQSLQKRIAKDIEGNKRTEDVMERSIERLNCYFGMDTIKIDVSNINAVEAAVQIREILGEE